jgi:hypothetical protein
MSSVIDNISLKYGTRQVLGESGDISNPKVKTMTATDEERVLIGCPPYETRSVKLPSTERRDLSRETLLPVWDMLAGALAEKGYSVGGVIMPPVRALLIMNWEEYVRFYCKCRYGEDGWREHCRNSNMKEHGCEVLPEESGGFLASSGPDEYVLCVDGTVHDWEVRIVHALLHVWEDCLKMKNGNLASLLEELNLPWDHIIKHI